jgi:hypothetical protein
MNNSNNLNNPLTHCSRKTQPRLFTGTLQQLLKSSAAVGYPRTRVSGEQSLGPPEEIVARAVELGSSKMHPTELLSAEVAAAVRKDLWNMDAISAASVC